MSRADGDLGSELRSELRRELRSETASDANASTLERVAHAYAARESAMHRRRPRADGATSVSTEEDEVSTTALNLEGLIGVVVRRLDDESLGEVVGGFVADDGLVLIVATRGSAVASSEPAVLQKWRHDEVSV